MLQIDKTVRGKKSPAITKPLHVRGCDDCFKDRAEWALWQLSLILAEIAENTWRDKDHNIESPPTLDRQCDNGNEWNLPNE